MGKARYYYHWTWKKNLPWILRDGLVPDIVMGKQKRCVRYRKTIPAAWVNTYAYRKR